ncbi:MAG TPA: hypothetical protein V6C72_11920 [Chroococcales cyanobacterium]
MSKLRKLTTQEEIFSQKASGRRALAARPIEEKVEILVKLQQMTTSFARAAGRAYKEPWNIKRSKQA